MVLNISRAWQMAELVSHLVAFWFAVRKLIQLDYDSFYLILQFREEPQHFCVHFLSWGFQNQHRDIRSLKLWLNFYRFICQILGTTDGVICWKARKISIQSCQLFIGVFSVSYFLITLLIEYHLPGMSFSLCDHTKSNRSYLTCVELSLA